MPGVLLSKLETNTLKTRSFAVTNASDKDVRNARSQFLNSEEAKISDESKKPKPIKSQDEIEKNIIYGNLHDVDTAIRAKNISQVPKAKTTKVYIPIVEELKSAEPYASSVKETLADKIFEVNSLPRLEAVPMFALTP